MYIKTTDRKNTKPRCLSIPLQTLALVDVWETDPPSTSIADIAFAPLSTENIELTNDYEPVAYQANRTLRASQAAMELNALQERNHATTAYSTLNCVASPLFPTFDAQRAINCAKDQNQGVGLYDQRSPALVQRASSGCDCQCGAQCAQQCECSQTYNTCRAPPIGYESGYYVRPHQRAHLKKKSVASMGTRKRW